MDLRTCPNVHEEFGKEPLMKGEVITNKNSEGFVSSV